MNVTHLSTRQADVRVSLDGVTFVRSGGSAARRGVERVLLIPWDHIEGGTLEVSRKNRIVLRLAVNGAPPVPDHRKDPHACTVDRGDEAAARDLMARIEGEVATRRRWKEHAAAGAGARARVDAEGGHGPAPRMHRSHPQSLRGRLPGRGQHGPAVTD